MKIIKKFRMFNRSKEYFNNESMNKIIKQICYFLFSKQKIYISILIALAVTIGIIPSVDSILLQKITDAIISLEHYYNQGGSIPSILIKWTIIYAIWTESLNVMWRLYDFIYLKAIPKIKAQVIDELYNHIQKHSYKFFQNNLSGDITNRIMEGANTIELIFCYMNEKILKKFSSVVFAMITMYLVHPIIFVIFLIWLVIFFGINLYFSKTINKYSMEYGYSRATVSGKIVDAIANIFAIRVFNNIRYEYNYLRNYLNETVKTDQKVHWFLFKLRCVLGTSCSITIFIIIYETLLLRINSLITIGDCILIITLCLNVIEDAWDLVEEFGEMFRQIGIFSQVITLLDKKHLDKRLNNSDTIRLIVESPTIEFKNVSFGYLDNKLVFNDKSIYIGAKQKVGIVGLSGSGKSTFINLIARIYDIKQGTILIDGQDISKVTRYSLRRNIAIIPQEPILFNRSIIENIRYGREDASYEEVIRAAEDAYIHDTIITLPDGYNTICGERGNNLSGGQRQRIVIARAILRNAKILLIDEATSSLDNYTEKLIAKSLYNLMRDKTVLVIAHKLSTIVSMDRILVLHDGKIVGDGTHKYLEQHNDLYKLLWEKQSTMI